MSDMKVTQKQAREALEQLIKLVPNEYYHDYEDSIDKLHAVISRIEESS